MICFFDRVYCPLPLVNSPKVSLLRSMRAWSATLRNEQPHENATLLGDMNQTTASCWFLAFAQDNGSLRTSCLLALVDRLSWIKSNSTTRHFLFRPTRSAGGRALPAARFTWNSGAAAAAVIASWFQSVGGGDYSGKLSKTGASRKKGASAGDAGRSLTGGGVAARLLTCHSRSGRRPRCRWPGPRSQAELGSSR